jgi:hypothetical protein
MWAPSASVLAVISYPQEGGRAYLADFALMMARGTPNYISYMWSDNTIPMGHEPEHQEFARAFRSLPAGHYREADRQQGVFCRVLDGKPAAFYVVNTTGQPITVELETGVKGTFTAVNTGKAFKVVDKTASFDLQPYELQVYVPK